MTYVFDTSSLIGAWTRSYPPEIFQGLWEELDTLVESGRIWMPEEVLGELKVKDDGLYVWVKARSQKMIVPTSRAVMLEARDVLADHKDLTKSGTGRSPADPFVIALAAIRQCPVVTQEQGGTASKPRIPYVCSIRGIRCVTFLDVIRAEGWTFTTTSS